MTHSYSRRDFVAWLSVMIAVSMYAQIGTLTGNRAWEERFTPPFAYSPFRTDADHLGAEVYNVANSIYRQGSFADPFGDATGPTAWVAPILPCLLAAGLLLAGGSKVVVTFGFFVMQCLVLAGIATIVTGLARTWNATWAGIVAIAVTGLIHFQYTFQITHDGVFAAGVLAAMIWGAASWLVTSMHRRRCLGWGLIGGIAGLTSPILGLVWAALSFVRLPWRDTLIPIGIAALIVSPWVVRNAIVFEKFIPTKSNAGFELYQALHEEPTGVVTRTSMNKHPYGQSNEHGVRYREIGEIAFVAEKLTKFQSMFWEKPTDYFDQVASRFEAAVWRLPNWLITVQFSLWHRSVAWLYPLFFLGFLASCLADSSREGQTPGSQWLYCSQVAYVVFLIPYVLVSFYERYAVALWLPQAVFVTWLLASGWTFVGSLAPERTKTNSA